MAMFPSAIADTFLKFKEETTTAASIAGNSWGISSVTFTIDSGYSIVAMFSSSSNRPSTITNYSVSGNSCTVGVEIYNLDSSTKNLNAQVRVLLAKSAIVS